MKVCLCKGITVWDMKAEDIVKDYLLFETEQNIDVGIPFKHKGKCYSSGLIMSKEKIVIAEEFQEKEEPKNVNFEGEITCPYCGSPESDSWERSDSENEEICGICGSTFSWIREVEVTYSSQLGKKHLIEDAEETATDGKEGV